MSNQESSDQDFDVIVIGAGPGGETCAVHLAKSGANVALIERELVGGECAYWGCMPSKALLRAPQLLEEIERVPGAAEAVTGELDVPVLLKRRDEVVRNLDDSVHAKRMTRRDITLIRGHGRLTGEREVEVEKSSGELLTLRAAKGVILAPGTRASIPPIPGLREAKAWTNREATLVKTPPKSLLVLGGGVIGVELAEAFAALKTDVTIIEAGAQLLGREEPEAAALIMSALEARGVTVRCGSAAEQVERHADGSVSVKLASGETLCGEELLVATGRAGAVDDLGLERLGIDPERGGIIPNNKYLQVPEHEWLYVVGDANGRAQLTHTAAYQARIVARSVMGLRTQCVSDRVSAPRVVFSAPQLAAVGYSLQGANDAGLRVKAFDRDPQRTAAASFYARNTEGFARLVVDLDAGTIVGATFVADDIAELLHSATIAIVSEVPIEQLRHCVAPFPTRSEVWTRLIEMMDEDEELHSRSGELQGALQE